MINISAILFLLLQLSSLGHTYSHRQMADAVDDIQKGYSEKEASKRHSVPLFALKLQLKKLLETTVTASKKYGPAPLFTDDEETEICSLINEKVAKGFVVDQTTVMKLAHEYAVSLGKRDPNCPLTRRWFYGFMNRVKKACENGLLPDVIKHGIEPDDDDIDDDDYEDYDFDVDDDDDDGGEEVEDIYEVMVKKGDGDCSDIDVGSEGGLEVKSKDLNKTARANKFLKEALHDKAADSNTDQEANGNIKMETVEHYS